MICLVIFTRHHSEIKTVPVMLLSNEVMSFTVQNTLKCYFVLEQKRVIIQTQTWKQHFTQSNTEFYLNWSCSVDFSITEKAMCIYSLCRDSQGSLLGLLFFVLQINMYLNINIPMYADDAVVFTQWHAQNHTFLCLTEELTQVQEWLQNH